MQCPQQKCQINCIELSVCIHIACFSVCKCCFRFCAEPFAEQLRIRLAADTVGIHISRHTLRRIIMRLCCFLERNDLGADEIGAVGCRDNYCVYSIGIRPPH